MELRKFNELKQQTSPTMCLAKFHEATIWLYSSKISSCHHTKMVETGTNVITFFNPADKRKQQSEMLAGKQPVECSYCWNLEKQNLTSDREYKSKSFTDHLPVENYLDPNFNFKPKALELAFQNTCNLACSYCSPSFSTEWIIDIKKNGHYTNLNTDVKKHYGRGIDNNIPVDMNLFWEWFDSVASGLESIRITGGEPLLHEETFKVFEKMQSINPNIECVIHTNLCQKPVIIQRFINSINNLKNVRINISNESSDDIAEFIRDGMVYSEWLENVKAIIENTSAKTSISTTITAAALIGLDQLYHDIIKIRKDNNPYISINIATYPEFQSLQCLSVSDREFYLDKYKTLFNNISSALTTQELDAIKRLISMLDPELTNRDHAVYRKDYDTFFEQYTARRNKPFNVATLLGKK